MNPLLMAAAKIRKPKLNNKLFGRDLVAGTMDYGYYGEFGGSEVIGGGPLNTLVGYGTNGMINTMSGWLGFAIGGKKLLIAKRPIRRSVSWTSLKQRNCIDGNRTITLSSQNNQEVILRLPRGANINPVTIKDTGWNHPSTHGSEWNLMMYSVVDTARSDYLPFECGRFAKFTQLELGFSGEGRYSWCQELVDSYDGRVFRTAVTVISSQYPDNTSTDMGWRPVLELIE